MKLFSSRYGKGRVRVLRLIRGDEGRHTVHEVDAQVMVEGDFAETYLTGDNSRVVTTDTIKNTVTALAQAKLTGVLEDFALHLSDHFLTKYEQLSQVEVQLTGRNWRRFQAYEGQPHPHTFIGDENYTPFTRVVASRASDRPVVESGVRDLLVMKSSGSAFKGFPKCEFTTLPETDDRVMATSIDATWTFNDTQVNFIEANGTILLALLNAFACEFSPSLQNTLYLMASAALQAVPEISQIHMKMPNKHYLPVNLTPFGLENDATIFLPTDEPHGQIEAVVIR